MLGGGTGMQIRGIYGHELFDAWEREVVVLGSGTEPSPDGARLTRLPGLARFGRFPVAQVRGFLELRRHLRKIRPDLLHTYFFWPILFGRILKLLGEVEYLVENREDEGFNWGAHEYGWLRLTRGLPDRVICVSESVRRHVLERERLPRDRVTVIHNGIPLPPKVPAADVVALRGKLNIDADGPVVGMVANMNRRVKGVHYFLESAAEILAHRPDSQFLVVGGGRELEHHRRRAEELGLSDAMCFTGFQENVAPLYELMDVSVLTSLSEGLSITLLESMGHELPVVVTRVGGNPEVVIDGTTGYLVPPRDAHALAGKVLHLLDDPELRTRMGLAARERVERDFSVHRTARDYAELFRGIGGAMG